MLLSMMDVAYVGGGGVYAACETLRGENPHNAAATGARRRICKKKIGRLVE